MRNTLFLIAVLSMIAVLAVANYFFQPFAPRETTKPTTSITQITPTRSPTNESTKQLKIKLAQLFLVPLVLTPQTKTDLPQWIKANRPGMILISGHKLDVPTLDQLNQALAKLNQKQPEPIWTGVINDGGEEQSLSGEGFTPLPSWRRLCHLSPHQAKTELASAAAELANVKINFVLSPSLDVATSSTALNPHLCSTNANRVTRYAMDYISAMNKVGILSVLKHFPGTGRLKSDLTDKFATIKIAQTDLVPFKTVIDQEDQPISTKKAVLVSLVGVEQSGGMACALTPQCVKQIAAVNDELLLFTDDLSLKAARFDPQTKEYTRTLSQVARQAVVAGNNVLYFGDQVSYAQLDQVLNNFVDWYQKDSQFKNKVDRSLVKISRFKSI